MIMNTMEELLKLAHETLRRGYTQKTSALTTPLANDFYGWLKTMFETHTREERENIPKDIVTLRNMFYEQYSTENKG